MESINLGDRVKDRITGLAGIAIGITGWLYGCRRVTIQPEEAKDGRPADTFTVDEPQLDLVEAGVIAPYETPVEPTPRHGPRPDASRRVDVDPHR
jgi:hypothetical protein